MDYDKRLMKTLRRLPLNATEASGSRVWDRETERWLLDFWNDGGVCSLGYNPREVQRVASRLFSEGVPHQLPDMFPNDTRWTAAEVICDRTGMDRAFFSNSGTEANEAAIKLARKFWWDGEGQPRHSGGTIALTPRRNLILTVQNNFHGRTGLSLAATDPRVSPYHRWGFGGPAPGFGVIDVVWDGGDARFVKSVTEGVEHPPAEVEWDRVAAVILAPVLANHEVRTYPRAFWRALRAIRERHDTLVIFDDVLAGSGRAGHYSTWQHPDIQTAFGRPDIVTLGKGVAMGFPMGVTLATEAVAESFTPGVHFNTFGGSPWVCAMAIEFFHWLDDHLVETRTIGASIRNRLADRSWVDRVDGWGMLNAFTPKWDGFTGPQFCAEARAEGLILATHRDYSSIRFAPPLNISPRELDTALHIMDRAYSRVTK